MVATKLPAIKELDGFMFDGTPLNEVLIRSLHLKPGSHLGAKPISAFPLRIFSPSFISDGLMAASLQRTVATDIRDRKAALGILDTDERTDQMRNNGSRRSDRKRAMLVRIAERVSSCGEEPLKANY